MRVEKAREEVRLSNQFDLIIVNDKLEKAKEEAFNAVSLFLLK